MIQRCFYKYPCFFLQVKDIKNNATEITQNAQAEANKIITIAQAEKASAVEAARANGLKLLFENLNITEQEKKDTFNYLHSLKGFNKAKLTVDFQQRIAGNL